jgi:uncharacterized protein (DUF58 family)
VTQSLPNELLDWGSLSPLRLTARRVTDGIYSGAHRSHRRGSGIEFDGHRDYVPGDDLRRLDSRALMRHGRLLIRQFETETERRLCLLVDATQSMAFRSERAPAAKYAYGALLAAALGRIAVSTGDTVSLDWIGGNDCPPLPVAGGREAFERLVGALEHASLGADEELRARRLEAVLAPISRRARRGSIVVVISDLIDLPEGSADQIAALSNRWRTAVVVQVLDPVEERFPFEGAVRLKSSFGGTIVETDGAQARAGYLAALEQQRRAWHRVLAAQGGRLVTCTTDEPAVDVVRRILLAAEGRGPLDPGERRP